MEQYTAPNYIAYSIPIFFLLIAIELIVARFKRRELYRLNDSISDLSAGILQQVVGIFSAVLFLALYIALYENFRLEVLFQKWGWNQLAGSPWVTHRFDAAWAPIAVFAVCFTLYDHQYYWFHRLSHEINVIWGSHVAHHSSEEYNLTVALRQGSLQGFFSFAFYVPLAIIGFHPITFFVAGQFVTLYQFWIHTRTIDKLPRWFEAIMNTPSHHRVHHGRNPQYIDRNHAGTFIIWDKMYGSFEPEGEEVVYGITNPLGTWNPVWAQFHYWIEVWQLARAAPRWRDKFLVWFKEPGWMPAGMGPHKTAPPVDPRTYKKFGLEVPRRLSLYALLNFVTVVPALLYLLGTAKNPAVFLEQRLLVAGYILLTLLNVGLIFDLKRYAYAWELGRLLVVGTAFYLLGQQTGNFMAGGIGMGAALLLLIWFAPTRRYFERNVEPSLTESRAA